MCLYKSVISDGTVDILIKEKILMGAGETGKLISVKAEKFFELIKKFVKKTGFKGIIDIDIFRVNGEHYISEVNPRFGGGYPHAYECGINTPRMIIENINGNANENVIGKYDDGIHMMKYNEVKLIKFLLWQY